MENGSRDREGGEILWDPRTRYHDESDTATTTMMMPRHVMKTPAGTNSAQVRGRGTKIARPPDPSFSIYRGWWWLGLINSYQGYCRARRMTWRFSRLERVSYRVELRFPIEGQRRNVFLWLDCSPTPSVFLKRIRAEQATEETEETSLFSQESLSAQVSILGQSVGH